MSISIKNKLYRKFNSLTLLQIETNYNIPFSNYLNSPQLECFCIFRTLSIEIKNIITNLKSGKSAGPFSIPIKLLKLLKSILSNH